MKKVILLIFAIVLMTSLQAQLVLDDTYLVDDHKTWKTEFYMDEHNSEYCIIVYYKNGSIERKDLEFPII